MRFFLATFGCKVNQYESQAIREAWQGFGWEESLSPGKADLCCINSCAITANGVRDAHKALLRLAREAPRATLILTGCAATLLANAQLPIDQLPIEADRVRLVPQDKKRLLLRQKGVTAILTHAQLSAEDIPPFAITHFPRARAVLKVQDGCTHRCTYCIVPTLRTTLQSRSFEDIVAEARTLLADGFRELILSGINLKLYGRDRPELGTFWDLVEHLERALAPEFAGLARIRISSVEPSQLNARGLDVLAKSRLLCPHLHISLQHADPRILRRMGRGHYTIEDLAKAMHEIQRFWPLSAFGCDLIAGFPGEDETSVETLLASCQALPFAYAHVFPYSARPNTAAASFQNQVPTDVRVERARVLRELFAQKNIAYRRQLLSVAPTLAVAFEQSTSEPRKGVCEYYVSCFLDDPCDSCDSRHSLVRVRPLGLTARGLRVVRV